MVVDTKGDRHAARRITPDAPESKMGNHDRAAELYRDGLPAPVVEVLEALVKGIAG